MEDVDKVTEVSDEVPAQADEAGETGDGEVKTNAATTANGDATFTLDPAAAAAAAAKEENDDDELDSDGWLDLLGSGRIKKRVVAKRDGDGGDGDRPKNGDTVKIKYKVSFEDRDLFDYREAELVLGEGEVVQAIDLALPVTDLGETAEVLADPDFAYGSVGLPSCSLPGNAAVLITFSLLENSGRKDKTEMEVQERSRIGSRKKDAGNWWFQRGEHQQAIQCYKRASEYFDDERLDLEAPIDKYSLPEEVQCLLDSRVKTLNNLALCQIKTGSWDSAFSSLQQVLKIEPNNEKALFRKSRVLQEKLRPDEAAGVLRRVTRLYPQNKEAQVDLARLTARLKKHRETESRMSKKMLGLDKYEEDKRKKEATGGRWGILLLKSGLAVGAAGALLGAAAARWKLWW